MTSFDLKDKTALVTGGSSGIGATVADLFMELGAKVCTADIKVSNSENSLYGDVSSTADVSRMTAEALARLGSIDILVNSAGVADTNTPTVEQKPETWQRIIDVNLTGTLLMCQAVGSYMVKRRRGAIVNISSVTGISAFPRRNNCVAPGYIRTPMVAALVEARKVDVDLIHRRTPLGRMGAGDRASRCLSVIRLGGICNRSDAIGRRRLGRVRRCRRRGNSIKQSARRDRRSDRWPQFAARPRRVVRELRLREKVYGDARKRTH